MKKWIIIFVIIIAVAVYFVWPKANVDKPIVMSVQYDEAAKTLAVSYIVAKNDDTYVMEIAQNTKGFYPPRTNGVWDGETNFTRVLAVQNGYELREDVVELTDKQNSYFLSLESRVQLVRISFEDYSPIETMMVLLIEDEAVDVTVVDHTLRYTYTVPEDVTIESIGHYDSEATISFEQNGKEVDFPRKVRQGSTIDIFINNPYRLSSKDRLLLEIEMKDKQSITKNILMTESIPEGYLKQIVKESNDGIH